MPLRKAHIEADDGTARMTLEWTLETLIQLAALGGLGFGVPVALYRLHGPSLGALAVNLVASVLIVFVAATALFGWLYLRQGVPADTATLGHVARLGLSSAIVWLPILLLTGLALGQRSEARLSKLRERREAQQS